MGYPHYGRCSAIQDSDESLVAFVCEVVKEVERARQKFPSSTLAMVALMEEVGELAKAALDEPSERVRAEAIQVAAMACRIALEGDDTLEARRRAQGLGQLWMQRLP